MSTAPAPEVRIMVTREMIEAHYKSVMNTAMTLLRQGDLVHAYSVLGNAIHLPYPIPAPAAIPEAAAREDDVWSTEEGELLADYFDNWVPPQAKSPGGAP